MGEDEGEGADGDQAGDGTAKEKAGIGDGEVDGARAESVGTGADGRCLAHHRHCVGQLKHVRWSGGCGMRNMIRMMVYRRLSGQVVASKARVWGVSTGVRVCGNGRREGERGSATRMVRRCDGSVWDELVRRLTVASVVPLVTGWREEQARSANDMIVITVEEG